LLTVFLVLVSTQRADAIDDPWADEVVLNNAIDPNQGFNTPEKTIGEPVGGGTYAPNNSSLHSVGRPGPAPGSYIILKFNTPVTDDDRNPMGLDGIVFGNNFWVGGDPLRKWIEAGLIEISEDVNENGLPDDPWYVIPGSRGLSAAVLPEGIVNPSPGLAGNVLNPNTDGTEHDWGYAELTPTVQKYLDNYVRPDDYRQVGLTDRSGGGDAFDIKWAVRADETGNPEGISQFTFIRISAFIAANIPPFGYITPEVDAVADVAPDVDTDGDGILDEYETRVAGADPARKESTVLALEIPPEFGGSPAGTKLGTASDASGNSTTLYSKGNRTGARDFNCVVDILSVADPAPSVSIPGKIKSAAARQFQSSTANFATGQVQDAELTIAYTSADIDGLDEPGLQPYRFDGNAFTQDGISSIVKDTAVNHITFRSAYSGIFVLASVAGSGDDMASAEAIVLNASPSQGTVGTPGTLMTFQTDPVHLADDSIVADGVLFTVAASLGTITTVDVDAGTAGIQVASISGIVTFSVQGGTTSGMSLATITSLDGTLHGEATIRFSPGPPSAPVEIWLLNPNATAPGPITFSTSVIHDAYGNTLETETDITLEVEGGEPTTSDADPSTPGHQLTLTGGAATFSVRALYGEAGDMTTITLSLYAEPELVTIIGEETFEFKVVKMPIQGRWTLLLAMGVCGVVALWRQNRRKSAG
jgi:hypothetical protein